MHRSKGVCNNLSFVHWPPVLIVARGFGGYFADIIRCDKIRNCIQIPGVFMKCDFNLCQCRV